MLANRVFATKTKVSVGRFRRLSSDENNRLLEMVVDGKLGSLRALRRNVNRGVVSRGGGSVQNGVLQGVLSVGVITAPRTGLK